MKEATFGYQCPVSGTHYRVNDSRLRGYGNPPSSPAAQTRFKGMGTFPMPRVLVPVDELPAGEQVLIPTDMIFEVPDDTFGAIEQPEPPTQDEETNA